MPPQDAVREVQSYLLTLLAATHRHLGDNVVAVNNEGYRVGAECLECDETFKRHLRIIIASSGLSEGAVSE